MRVLSTIALLLLSSAALAQGRFKEGLCNSASASTIGHNAGVIVQRVIISGTWGSNAASVYLPDKEIADGAVLFSHSAIQTDTGATVDLLPFASTLARAGAVVIVPERSLVWPPTDRSMNREGAVVICAEHWLIDHAKVFNNGEPTVNEKNLVVRQGYAYVGPRLCDPADPSDCQLISPFNSGDCAVQRYCRDAVYVDVGETGNADNTRRIISDGGLRASGWLQRHLGLAPIQTLVPVPPASGS